MILQFILTAVSGPVGVIELNRPKQRNALSAALVKELRTAVDTFEAADDIGAIVVTGNETAFAAGADIKEMVGLGSFADAHAQEFSAGDWLRLSTCRKPVIAAVAGYALGGGCELAMMCDFILAADTAKFGQIEITLGTIPGAGGTQRLARFVGKSKAMEMALSGRLMDAAEAERVGLVSRIVPQSQLVEEAIRVATKIAEMSRPAAMLVKESINQAFETPLSAGLLFERRAFHATFALHDRKEGMAAFVEKRKPRFANR